MDELIPGGLWVPRESRKDKDPPASYFAQVVARLEKAFPGAALSQATLETLKPFLVRAWRNGFNARQAAAAHCACEGTEIVPSPGTLVELQKGEVYPPPKAQRGEIYPPEALRSTRDVQRQQRELQVELEAAVRFHTKALAAEKKTEGRTGRRLEAALEAVRKLKRRRNELAKSARALAEKLDARSRAQVFGRVPAATLDQWDSDNPDSAMARMAEADRVAGSKPKAPPAVKLEPAGRVAGSGAPDQPADEAVLPRGRWLVATAWEDGSVIVEVFARQDDANLVADRYRGFGGPKGLGVAPVKKNWTIAEARASVLRTFEAQGAKTVTFKAAPELLAAPAEKKKPGRPKKAAPAGEAPSTEATPVAKKKPGRPKKAAAPSQEPPMPPPLPPDGDLPAAPPTPPTAKKKPGRLKKGDAPPAPPAPEAADAEKDKNLARIVGDKLDAILSKRFGSPS